MVLEQAELRSQGRRKFSASGRLFFTGRGLEQATDQWIAAYKAARFPAGERVADLCCGIGGDCMGLAGRGPVEGFDRDPIVATYAHANVRRGAPAHSATARAVCGDAELPNLSDYAAWHVDPDRRSDERRTVDPQRMSPDRDSIDRMLVKNENVAIKLAPATNAPQSWQERAELEWISRARECRQLIVWFGGLAQAVGMRRATVLDANGAVAAQVTGERRPLPPAAQAILGYLYEPDPCVLAAGLAGHLAQTYPILPVAKGIPYFTSDELIDDPALSAFRVSCALPFAEKRLSDELRSRDVGRLEIKCRGVRLAPETLRKRLRLQGERNGALLVTPHDGRTIAILAERIDRTEMVSCRLSGARHR